MKRGFLSLWMAASCHIAYRTLYLLKENNIIVSGLLAVALHVLQPLDVGVLGTLEGEFRKLLAYRNVVTKKISTMI